MARIRTYKPDFFSDKRTGKLSCNAKVVFLGLVSYADDYGLLRYEPDELKVKILPYSSGSEEDLIEKPINGELKEAGLIDVFSDGQKEYIHIRTFVRHQRVPRRGYPILKGWDLQMTAAQYMNEHANESFVELAYDGHGEGGESDDGMDDAGSSPADINSATTAPAAPAAKPAPTKNAPKDTDKMSVELRTKIVDLYREHFPLGSKILGWPVKRQAALRARSIEIYKGIPKEDRSEEALLAAWAEIFKRCAKSSFLTGDNDRGWVANLDFMLQASRFNDIQEGKYDNRGGKSAQAGNNNTSNKKRPAIVRASIEA